MVAPETAKPELEDFMSGTINGLLLFENIIAFSVTICKYIYMKTRLFWIQKIEDEWKKRSILWLSGVRRSGKTVLCQSLGNIQYFDCELPSVRRQMEDPEAFLEELHGQRIVLDEIHRLKNPSEILKIAADHFPDIKILATGSSTLQASAKFKDTLTGRKSELWLTPMISIDLRDFKNTNLKHRLLNGGLPPFFLSKKPPERDFQEWVDSYWARDIQELFRVGKHSSFERFLELIFINSGGIFEASKYAAPCEISRPTVSNYLSVLEKTWVAHVVRPYAKKRQAEIISAPKVYAFDTGFVCYYRGWSQLRDEDLGHLWEHYVLNEMHGRTQSREIFYWRDKRGHEIDFVLAKKGRQPVVVECKWSLNNIESRNIRSFRRAYPEGENYIVSQAVSRPYSRRYGEIKLNFVGLEDLIRKL